MLHCSEVQYSKTGFRSSTVSTLWQALRTPVLDSAQHSCVIIAAHCSLVGAQHSRHDTVQHPAQHSTQYTTIQKSHSFSAVVSDVYKPHPSPPTPATSPQPTSDQGCISSTKAPYRAIPLYRRCR
jgi:hypothetical protein